MSSSQAVMQASRCIASQTYARLATPIITCTPPTPKLPSCATFSARTGGVSQCLDQESALWSSPKVDHPNVRNHLQAPAAIRAANPDQDVAIANQRRFALVYLPNSSDTTEIPHLVEGPVIDPQHSCRSIPYSGLMPIRENVPAGAVPIICETKEDKYVIKATVDHSLGYSIDTAQVSVRKASGSNRCAFKRPCILDVSIDGWNLPLHRSRLEWSIKFNPEDVVMEQTSASTADNCITIKLPRRQPRRIKHIRPAL